jgi:hypothetical protein
MFSFSLPLSIGFAGNLKECHFQHNGWQDNLETVPSQTTQKLKGKMDSRLPFKHTSELAKQKWNSWANQYKLILRKSGCRVISVSQRTSNFKVVKAFMETWVKSHETTHVRGLNGTSFTHFTKWQQGPKKLHSMKGWVRKKWLRYTEGPQSNILFQCQ